MPTEAVLDKPFSNAAPNQSGTLARLRSHWPLVLACVAFAIPTIIRLAEGSWSLEIGAHGPIVLATGLWLLSRCDWSHQSGEGRSGTVQGLTWAAIVVSLILYVFGRAYDFLALETAGLYFALIGVLVLAVGARTVFRNTFPLLYLAFLIPPPGWVIDAVTAPLQHFISFSATELLRWLDYPVSRSGVAIEVAQYRLLVEQACSGMNSIVGLTAVTLFYIYLLHGSSWRYAILLMALILPIAVFVNFLRVCTLILVTYHYGDAVAQGVFHNTAGVALFALALALMFLIDAGLRKALGGRLQ
ncbi:exosortase [Erythrobacter litoralis]|uniref:exosortase V n=1 Tax=Erythrobacter litoralis TaxID=39960 RepID=UPI002434957C|nr:exosortase V [Erythrobacter litoralis]MDG6079111.1 exosortase [Erythrobacter litoralis]